MPTVPYFFVSMAAWRVERRAPSLYQAMAGEGYALLVTLHFSLSLPPALTFLLLGVLRSGFDTEKKQVHKPEMYHTV